MDRIIGSEIKPLLVDELLFGSLKKGGICVLGVDGDRFVLKKEGKKKDGRVSSK